MENSASIVAASEIVKGRLFFVTLTEDASPPRGTRSTCYFCVDDEYIYNNFYKDFGPHSLGTLYKYCVRINEFMERKTFANKRLVQYTTVSDPRKRLNAAFLIGSYAIIYHGKQPEEIMRALSPLGSPTYMTYRDASLGPDVYPLKLEDCFLAVKKAKELGFFKFDSFDVEEYEFFEKVENGDFNWILPGKFLAFCGPHNESKLDNDYPVHAPEAYFRYFKKHGVSTIVRLNKRLYDAARFRAAGFQHFDLFFNDGSVPSDAIVRQFLEIAEKSPGAVAVHCKAGLGRTGVLIGCYIMKHYRFTAAEAIAWLRICRPGSVIGYQQTWLEQKQAYLWLQGDLHKSRSILTNGIHNGHGSNNLNHNNNVNNNNNNSHVSGDGLCVVGADGLPKFTRGVYHLVDGNRNDLCFPTTPKEVAKIMSQVNTMKIQDGGGSGSGTGTGTGTGHLKSGTAAATTTPPIPGKKTRTSAEVDYAERPDEITQGDELNRLKAQRRQLNQHGLPAASLPLGSGRSVDSALGRLSVNKTGYSSAVNGSSSHSAATTGGSGTGTSSNNNIHHHQSSAKSASVVHTCNPGGGTTTTVRTSATLSQTASSGVEGGRGTTGLGVGVVSSKQTSSFSRTTTTTTTSSSSAASLTAGLPGTGTGTGTAVGGTAGVTNHYQHPTHHVSSAQILATRAKRSTTKDALQAKRTVTQSRSSSRGRAKLFR